MARFATSMAKTTQFHSEDKNAYWYVSDLDPNRPMRRGCSRDRWISIVNGLLEPDADGHLVHRAPSLDADDGVYIVRVGTPDWKNFLRRIVYSTGFRMCWEPKPFRERRREQSLFADDDAALPVKRRRRTAA
jgi:hypothetical protein